MSTPVLLLVLALALTALFLPLRALQLSALLFLTAILLCWGWSRLLARYVRVRRVSLVARAHRFEPLEVCLELENRCFLPAHFLTVLDPPNAFFASEPGRFLVSLRPGERKTLRYTLESQSRGEYTVGPAVLGGCDPLGLFPFSRRQAEPQTVIVYPEVLPVSLRLDQGLPAGSIRSENRIYEDLTRYRSLREYLPGDALKRLNWKASARTGRLFVTDYLPTLYAPALILLDLCSDRYPMRYRYHRMERAVVLAASLVMHFVARGQEVGLVAAAAGGPTALAPRSGADQAMVLLETLARLQPAGEASDLTRLPAEAGIRLAARSRLEVITPGLGPEQCSALRQHREQGCEVEVFLVGGQQARQTPGGPFDPGLRLHDVPDFGDALIAQ